MDTLLERWRRQRATPLDDAGVRRYHRRNFGVAVASLVYVLLLLTIYVGSALESGLDVPGGLLLAGLFAIAVYLWRVVRRRWRRL